MDLSVWHCMTAAKCWRPSTRDLFGDRQAVGVLVDGQLRGDHADHCGQVGGIMAYEICATGADLMQCHAWRYLLERQRHAAQVHHLLAGHLGGSES